VKFEDVRRMLRRQWRLLLAATGLLVGAYALVGFLLVPYIARSAIEKYVTQDLKRHVSIGKITFNPFSLKAEIHSFSITEADNSPIVRFDFLRLNAQISSILYRAWTFREVRLDRPDLQVIVDKDGLVNLGKLRAPQAEPPAPGTRSHVPALRIATLAVHSGRIGFEDHNSTRKTPFTATLKPIEFTLTNFRTEPDYQNAYNFQATTLAGERLAWSGQFSVQPTGSTGRFEISDLKSSTIAAYLEETLGFDLRSGFVDLQGDYELTLSDMLHFAVDLPTLKLREFGIAPSKEDTAEPWIRLPLVEVSNSSFVLEDRKIQIGRILVDQAGVDVWRDKDGQLNLPRLLGEEPAATPETPSTPFLDGWNFGIGTIAVRSASINAEDRMTAPPVKLNLTVASVNISDYSNAPGNVTRMDADITAGGKGKLIVTGDFAVMPMIANADINLTDFELPPLQPYFIDKRPLEMTSGRLSLKGKVRVMDPPARGEPGVRFAGEMAIADIATRETESNLDFLNWKMVRIAGIRFTQTPDRLDIDRIEARQPYGRFLISVEQRLNIARVLSGNTGEPGPVKPAAPAMKVAVRSVVITDGAADFTDFSVEPNFSASIFGLNGSITGLSSDLNSRADVKLEGSVDRYSPVEISGQVNLLSAAIYSDMAIKFRNMELTTFNPYSGKYAGYSIRKGKLTTDLQYKVDNRKLEAQHHIVLDQLEFGDATDSKEKVPLPIKLAAALLKDRQGVIDLKVPVSGSIDDPSFRLGPIIWQAFKGLLDRIVTAPFKLLGSLFGKGDELEYVEFRTGSATLPADQQEKIATLAKALVERPEIRLDVPLRALTPADDGALARGAFDAALGRLLAPATPGVPVTREQRLAALEQLYLQQMGAAPVFPAPATPDADVVGINTKFLEDALQPKFAATPAARDQLARERADAVQSALLENTQVNPERVFLTERESGKSPVPDTVRMELRLE
jgi:hypothetical protein